ncbi:MAG: hypothetical protein RMK45_07500 [Armatimonadota bacterium]|nr:hypothetical protein [Armatimonadota bacterium]
MRASRLRGVARLFLLCLVLGGISACQPRLRQPVRIDLARAAIVLASKPLPAPRVVPTPAIAKAVAPSAVAIGAVAPPPPSESLRQRRQVAVRSIEQQREAVYQQLLSARLRSLAELEPRWEAELRAEYDLSALRAERDAEWQAAFQAYGRKRFPLLVTLAFAAPDIPAHREAQAQLTELERAWQQQEQAIEARYQAQQARIEQEIAVRLSVRRREFTRAAEQEVQAQLQQQLSLAELYLPQPQRLPAAPARKEAVPALRASLPSYPLHAAYRARLAQSDAIRLQLLKQLAREWAQAHGYRLTTDPNAPDRTEAFIRYLLAR